MCSATMCGATMCGRASQDLNGATKEEKRRWHEMEWKKKMKSKQKRGAELTEREKARQVYVEGSVYAHVYSGSWVMHYGSSMYLYLVARVARK